jgi:endonuclease YncB( thermonuclease family)
MRRNGSRRVVGVTDGDTITVLAPRNEQYTIRLAGIDAPEHNQAFGQRSKQNLSRLVFGKNVALDCLKEESYGRLICKVIADGSDADLAQVRDGLAWHYKQYQDEQAPADRTLYTDTECTAHKAHAGLWSDASPVAPWDFRHGTVSAIRADRNGCRVSSEPANAAVSETVTVASFTGPDAPITTRFRRAIASISRTRRRRKRQATARHEIARDRTDAKVKHRIYRADAKPRGGEAPGRSDLDIRTQI